MQCLHYLLSAGCEVKADCFGDTPVRIAEIYGHKECIQLIQEQITDVTSSVENLQANQPDSACGDTSETVSQEVTDK